MMRFQRAYQANAQFFTVIDETIQTLLSLKR
jgi:flagellar hook-associated protein FlgK